MPRALLLTALLAAAAPLAARAQVSKISYTLGFGQQRFRSTAPEGQFSTRSANIPHYVLGISYDQPVWGFAREQALGLVVAAQAGIFVIDQDNSPESGFTLDMPVYATYRYGAKSTKKSDKSFGVGLGGGARPGYMFWGMADAPITRAYAVPSAMLEGVYSATRADFYLRLTYDLGQVKYYNYYTSEGRVPAASYQSMLLQFGLTF